MQNVENLKFEDVDAMELSIEHFSDLKQELGYDTVWSMESYGHLPGLDFKIFTDKPRIVTYKCIKDIGPNLEDTEWVTFTAVAENGTLGAMWKAAESCFQQAKLAIGDWHYFVEDFEMQEDGSLSLTTGS